MLTLSTGQWVHKICYSLPRGVSSNFNLGDVIYHSYWDKAIYPCDWGEALQDMDTIWVLLILAPKSKFVDTLKPGSINSLCLTIPIVKVIWNSVFFFMVRKGFMSRRRAKGAFLGGRKTALPKLAKLFLPQILLWCCKSRMFWNPLALSFQIKLPHIFFKFWVQINILLWKSFAIKFS